MQIEVQAQREPECVWRDLEYFALLCRLRGVPGFPIALFPIVDVLGGGHGSRPRLGYERVEQREVVLGYTVPEFAFAAVTLRALEAAPERVRTFALAGAASTRMVPMAG